MVSFEAGGLRILHLFLEPFSGYTSRAICHSSGLRFAATSPASVRGRHLSKILELPTFQPLPKRTMTTTVTHIGHELWLVDVQLEASQFASAAQRSLAVVLERKRFPVVDHGAGEVLIWEPDDVADRAFSATADSKPGREHYQARLPLPYPRGFRVKVTESELYATHDVKIPGPRPRLVYIDATEDLGTLMPHRHGAPA